MKPLKVQTQYQLTKDTYITVNEEVADHFSIHVYGEPCSGVVRHWGSKKKLIAELKELADALEKFNP